MLSINTNLSSLIAQNSLKNSTSILNQAVERMTTGYKINHAKDNAANYSISTNMTTKINSYMVAEDNAASALDMVNTAEGTLSQIQDKLERLRALQEQASNGTYGEQSRNAINAEVNALVDEIERLYSTAEYNGIKLFSEEGFPSAGDTGETGSVTGNFVNPIAVRDTSGMTAMSTIDETQTLAVGTYSISTADDLQKLATITNNGLLTAGSEFVLASDIDLTGITATSPSGMAFLIGDSNYNFDNLDTTNAFKGVFDGNGYTIKMTFSDNFVALFGTTDNAELKNVALEVESSQGPFVGAPLASLASNTVVDNVCSTGTIIYADGTVAYGISSTVAVCTENSIIQNSYSDVDIIFEGSASGYAGGFVGNLMNSQIVNCEYAGNMVAQANGLTGAMTMVLTGSSSITNSKVTGVVSEGIGIFTATTQDVVDVRIENCQYNSENVLQSIELNYMTNVTPITTPAVANYSLRSVSAPIFAYNAMQYISFQIGINSNSASQLTLNTGFILESLSDIRNIGLDTTNDYLTQLDTMLATVSAKQTEYGAASNRLESVLEEIQIQYDNLVSSRSTIRDADIATESSKYIQQQILQEATATLMSTANQSPAIALQLI